MSVLAAASSRLFVASSSIIEKINLLPQFVEFIDALIDAGKINNVDDVCILPVSLKTVLASMAFCCSSCLMAG